MKRREHHPDITPEMLFWIFLLIAGSITFGAGVAFGWWLTR